MQQQIGTHTYIMTFWMQIKRYYHDLLHVTDKDRACTFNALVQNNYYESLKNRRYFVLVCKPLDTENLYLKNESDLSSAIIRSAKIWGKEIH